MAETEGSSASLNGISGDEEAGGDQHKDGGKHPEKTSTSVVLPHDNGEASGDRNVQESELEDEDEDEEDDEEEEEEEEEEEDMDGSDHFSLTEDGEGGRRESLKDGGRWVAQKRNNNRSSSSDEEHKDEDDDKDDEDDDEETTEAWLGVELRDSHRPAWSMIPSLHRREIGKDTHQFARRLCGSRYLVQRLEMQGWLKRHSGCVNTLHFNSSGTRLASGSDDLRVVIWNWTNSEAVLDFDSGHQNNVFQAKFLPHCGDSTLVTCARDGQIRMAELSATNCCKSTRQIAQHKGAAHKLALQPDSPCFFLSAGEDAVVLGIDLRLDNPANKLAVVKEGDKKVGLYTIHINPAKTQYFAAGGKDQYIRIYDQRKINENDNNGVLKKFCPSHLVSSESKTNITCLVYSYNGTELLASYNDEDIYLFDSNHSDGADYCRRYKGHRNNATVKGVNFYGPCSEFVVSGSDCGNIYLWDKHSARIVQFMEEADRSGVVNCLEPHPHQPNMVTSGLDHYIKVWAPTAKTPTRLKGLKQVIKNNKRERDEESLRHGNHFDTQLLWFLMRQMGNRRPPGNLLGVDAQTDESWSSPDTSDEEEGGPDHVQCMSS
ncbi:DDB1- and CUL4-associated factor 8 [Stigmatopora argus]